MKKFERKRIADYLTGENTGEKISINGWIRTRRSSKNVTFLTVNDGSTIHNMQVVIDMNTFKADQLQGLNTGAAVEIAGELLASQGSGQKVELNALDIKIVGPADINSYPLQPKRHSLEFLREIGHLRFRTNTFGSINRVRHAMIFAIHKFFNDKGFFNIHTPIITGSDCEGAGEMFRVSTLPMKNAPLDENGNINYKEDFFGKETNLTVSGQLEAELAALALSRVYTFGPTFRAENSNTSRHLAEFWMIEPEIAFSDIHDNMNLAEEMLKYLVRYALDNCRDDLEFLSKRQQEEEKTKKQQDRSIELIEKLNSILQHDFVRINYTEAFEILKGSNHNKKNKFAYPVENWGMDLQSEHERFLVEKHYKKPVIITDYPKEIKAFYMKQNEDGKTVRAMDILFPGIGEIVGGSQREENLQRLKNRIKELNLPEEDFWWYIDTRKFGSCKHAGYGLGFERLMLFITGMTNIRDVIPFPRTPKNAEF